MTNEKDDLAIARVNKATDNTKVKPTEVLKTIIHDIESGVIKCDTLLIVAISTEPKSWGVNYYRCNVRRMEEVAFYEMAKHSSLLGWVEGG